MESPYFLVYALSGRLRPPRPVTASVHLSGQERRINLPELSIRNCCSLSGENYKTVTDAAPEARVGRGLRGG